jgi:hypothetical protein
LGHRYDLGQCSFVEYTYYQFIRQIVNIGCVIDEINWIHIVHETNQVDVALTKYGLNLDVALNFFHVVPSLLVDSFRGDLLEIVFPKCS